MDWLTLLIKRPICLAILKYTRNLIILLYEEFQFAIIVIQYFQLRNGRFDLLFLKFGIEVQKFTITNILIKIWSF